jgi:protein gp37
MSDLFHEKAPDEWLDKIFAVMAQCPQHTFQILTKRPARMKEYFLPAKYQQSNGRNQYRLYHIAQAAKGLFGTRDDRAVAAQSRLLEGEVPNIHLGVSCENQAAADERIPILLQTPAAVRFISAEPLLGALNIESYLSPGRPRQPASPALNTHGQTGSERHQAPGCDALADAEAIAKKEGITRQGANLARVEIGLDWVIVGGESGSNARPCDLAWIKGIVDQCKTAGVACFVKQMGTHPYFGGTLDDPDMVIFPSDRKGGVITEFPASLQVREFPKDVRNSIQQNGGSILIHDAPPPAS